MEKNTAKRMSDGRWLVCMADGELRRVANAEAAKKALGVDGPND